MACELDSDSDDVYITKVSEGDAKYMLSRFAHYLTNASDISVEIKHIRGQPAEMNVKFGTGRISSLAVAF